VRTAHSGAAGLEGARALRTEAVLLDIGMPGMDGYEVVRRLRQEPGLEGVLRVALTGYGQEEDRRRSRQATIDYHLVKPLDPRVSQSPARGPGPTREVGSRCVLPCPGSKRG
jgi:two-component system CheB/CheR fusion protein